MNKGNKILALVATIAAIFLGIGQFMDTSWNLLDRHSKHEETTQICARGEIVVVKALSPLGEKAGKTLAQQLSPSCRVHGPERAKNESVDLVENEIRYFHHEDESKAKSLAEKVLEYSQIAAKPSYLPGLAKEVPKQYHAGYLEVWLR